MAKLSTGGIYFIVIIGDLQFEDFMAIHEILLSLIFLGGTFLYCGETICEVLLHKFTEKP